MIEIISAGHAQISAPQAIWRASFGDRFPIMPACWETNTHRDPSFEPSDLILALESQTPVGFLLTKRWRGEFPGCEHYKGIATLALMAVLPAYQRQGIGKALLETVEGQFRAAGIRKVILGGSFHHFLPGVPENAPEALAFFSARGYGAHHAVWDVRRPQNPDKRPLGALKGGFEVRLFSRGEEIRLVEFLKGAFPGRWARDMAFFLEQGGDIAQVMGLFAEGRPRGFAWLHPPGSKGASRWAGFNRQVAALGPIGIALEARGLGLGLALLDAGLAQLALWGASDMVIDWTDLLEFYAQRGFKPWLSYTLASKMLL